MCWYMPLEGALLILKKPVLSFAATARSTSTMPIADAGASRREKKAAARRGGIATTRTAFSPPSHESRKVTVRAPPEAPSRSAK